MSVQFINSLSTTGGDHGDQSKLTHDHDEGVSHSHSHDHDHGGDHGHTHEVLEHPGRQLLYINSICCLTHTL